MFIDIITIYFRCKKIHCKNLGAKIIDINEL